MPEDIKVTRRTSKEINRVDGDLYIDDATVKAGRPGGVIEVSGMTEYRNDCFIESGLETDRLRGSGGDIVVDGDLTAKNSIRIRHGELEVRGDLETIKLDVDRRVKVSGNMKTDLARVGGSLRVKGDTKAARVDVGGSFKVDSDADVGEIDVGGSVKVEGSTKSGLINVGGTFKGYGPVEAEKIDVGGSVKLEDKADVEEIDVGGSVKVVRGRTGDVKVGGSFKAREPINFSTIKVGGSVKIAGGIGGHVDVGGSFKSDGDLTFQTIDVGGTVKIDGSGKGGNIDVGGTVRVRGDLDLQDELKVGGKADIGGVLKARVVRVGGRVEGEKIEAQDLIKTNTLRTRLGAKAGEIDIGRRGEAEGPLIAGRVLVRERARVEDVYADTVYLRRGSRAVNIYARKVTVENRCIITGQVKFTEEVNIDRDARLSYEPEKVESLPEPPF
ncbi:MAG: hypothetical protein PVJ38_03515 [Candidatus Bathyarchaeota archaeon]